MKKIILSLAVASTCILASCGGEKKVEENSSTPSTTETVAPTTTATTPVESNIVNSTAIGNNGVKLEMSFDNEHGTATFVLNKDTINMTQDTTASGISYHNKNYSYVEHQGEIEMKKDGKVIFLKTEK